MYSKITITKSCQIEYTGTFGTSPPIFIKLTKGEEIKITNNNNYFYYLDKTKGWFWFTQQQIDSFLKKYSKQIHIQYQSEELF